MYPCKFCQSGYRSNKALKQHVRDRHGEKNVCPYPECTYTYARSRPHHLQGHMRNQHSVLKDRTYDPVSRWRMERRTPGHRSKLESQPTMDINLLHGFDDMMTPVSSPESIELSESPLFEPPKKVLREASSYNNISMDKDTGKSKDKDKDKGTDKDMYKDKGKCEDMGMDKDTRKSKSMDKDTRKSKSMDKDTGKSKDMDKDKGTGKDMYKDTGKGKDKDMDKDTGKSKDMDKDKDTGKDMYKDKGKGKDMDGIKDKDEDKENEELTYADTPMDLTLRSPTRPTSSSTGAVEAPVPPIVKEQAMNLLRHGGMPLFPPALRDWSSMPDLSIQVDDDLKWPPKNWSDKTEDQKLFLWEIAAANLQSRMNADIDVDRVTVCEKFNFLALPGTVFPRPTSGKNIHAMRLANYCSLRDIVQTNNDVAGILPMFLQAAVVRDKDTDEVVEKLQDVPLLLNQVYVS